MENFIDVPLLDLNLIQEPFRNTTLDKLTKYQETWPEVPIFKKDQVMDPLEALSYQELCGYENFFSWKIPYISIFYPILFHLKTFCIRLDRRDIYLSFINELKKTKKNHYSYRFVPKANNIKEMIMGWHLLNTQEEFLSFFLDIFFKEDMQWQNAAKLFSEEKLQDDLLIEFEKFSSSCVARAQNIANKFLDTSVQLKYFTYIFISCRVYLERMSLYSQSLCNKEALMPLKKKNINIEKLTGILQNIAKKPAEDIQSFKNFIPEYKTINPEAKLSCSSVLGRDVITYFMENLQMRVPSAGFGTFEELHLTPLFIKRSLSHFVKNTLKNFQYISYLDHMPYSSFRTLYIKNLISNLNTRLSSPIQRILDPFGGWGGTLLGSIFSKTISFIYDSDINPALFEKKKEMRFFLNSYLQSNTNLHHKEIHLLQKSCSEISLTDVHNQAIDMVCCSPPFMGYEDYAKAEENEKFRPLELTKKMKTLEQWYEEYVKDWVKQIGMILREGGLFAIQISNTASHKKLVNGFIKTIQDANTFDNSFDSFVYSQPSRNPSYNYFFVFTKKMSLFRAPSKTQDSLSIKRDRDGCVDLKKNKNQYLDLTAESKIGSDNSTLSK